MATATESETKPKESENYFEVYSPVKETCPRCKKKHLHTNDSEKFDEIMTYSCIGCGYTFYEDESTKKWRKEREKADKNKASMSWGLLLLVSMLATIAVIYSKEESEAINEVQTIESQAIDTQPVNTAPTEYKQVN